MQRPLNFCMVTTFYPPHSFGGDGMQVYRLSNELARRGRMRARDGRAARRVQVFQVRP